MKLIRALNITGRLSQSYSADKLNLFPDDGLVRQACEATGIATVRKRRLPLEAVISVWGVS